MYMQYMHDCDGKGRDLNKKRERALAQILVMRKK